VSWRLGRIQPSKHTDGFAACASADLRKAEAGADTARQTVVENGDILINGELNRLKRGNLSTAAASLFERHQRLRMDSLERNGSEAQSHTLLDLFWTVYSKFRAVLEGQRIVSEVVGRIAMASLRLPLLSMASEAYLSRYSRRARTVRAVKFSVPFLPKILYGQCKERYARVLACAISYRC